MAKIKYKIKKKEFHDELTTLGNDEGSYSGWGRFIETDNKKLKEFFDEYLCIAHEDQGAGSYYCIGRYSDVADYFWDYAQTPTSYAKLFKELIEMAIKNEGMYKGFGNDFN
ncbi:MAG: hypothetical protein [Caudoviricetes sp.]|nr:MAG: hypothetical protein [Caudoviricetes sp.]